ncbi:hypothetical protein N5V81_05250 [Escherichia coli]|nr:hypothetical protein [Escherichia coli]
MNRQRKSILRRYNGSKQIEEGVESCRLFWWPDGEAACIYADTIEWRKTFRGMA